jgi:hypothetical protein
MDPDPAKVLNPYGSGSTTRPSTNLLSRKIYMLHRKVDPELEPQREMALASAN